MSASLHSLGRGRFEIGPRPEHLLMVQVGIPVRIACRIDDQYRTCTHVHGDIALLPAGSSGTWEIDSASVSIRFAFTPALLRKIAADTGIAAPTLAPQLQERDAQVAHIAAALDEAMTSDTPIGRLYAESLGTALLTRIVTRFSADAPVEARGLTNWQLQRVVDHIEAHIERDLLLADLAAVAGLSVSHFRSLFRRSMGLPVHRYVIRRRVERASKLLMQGRSISEAALEAGFADQSHLARCMRQTLGMLPKDVARLSGAVAQP